jgi:DNA-binding transcriptional LysR family regulator
MQTAWLEDLIALAQARSFSAAAQARHLTQPAFGRRINSLEQWAGTTLVERRRAPVALTPAGARLLQFALEAVPGLAQAREDLRGLRGGDEVVTLVTGRTLARTIAADWLARAQRKLGDATVRIQTGSMAQTLQWLERGECQFMLAYHHPAIAMRLSPSTYLQRTVAYDRLVPMVRTGMVLPTGKADTKPLPYLAYSEKLALGQLVRDHLVNLAQAPRLRQRVVCDSADALLEYALKGLGVAWLPWSLAVGAHRAKQLSTLGGKALQIAFEVRMVRPKKRLGSIAETLWDTVELA